MDSNTNNDWKSCKAQVFWGEIAPTDHVVQIYENDAVFIDMLEGFVSGGLKMNECVIVIATSSHLQALEDRLKLNGFNINDLCSDDQFIPLNAEATLSKFMRNGWPDENLFKETVSSVIARAHHNKRQVRAFGEMVALLWAQGLNGATVQLEDLWNRFCETEAFYLFCAYPKSGFTQDTHSSMDSICCTHSKMISGNKSKTEIFYKAVHKK